MDMDREREIVQDQIDKHWKINAAAVKMGEHKMALEHLNIAEALEAVLEAVK